jgi:hypothetical protein
MRVFISWSKEPSRTVALALRDWLPDLIQSLAPFMSSADIGAGARWSTEIAKSLESAKIGIICVSPENQAEPWLLFETGALAKTLDGTFVCPYLINMRPADLLTGPLTQFQSKTADKDGTFELVSTINAALSPDTRLPEDRLRRLFDRNWPELQLKIEALPSGATGASKSVSWDQPEMMSEILETVRSLARRLPEAPTPPENFRGMTLQEYASLSVQNQAEEILQELSRVGYSIPRSARAKLLRRLVQNSHVELGLTLERLRIAKSPAQALEFSPLLRQSLGPGMLALYESEPMPENDARTPNSRADS